MLTLLGVLYPSCIWNSRQTTVRAQILLLFMHLKKKKSGQVLIFRNEAPVVAFLWLMYLTFFADAVRICCLNLDHICFPFSHIPNQAFQFIWNCWQVYKLEKWTRWNFWFWSSFSLPTWQMNYLLIQMQLLLLSKPR